MNATTTSQDFPESTLAGFRKQGIKVERISNESFTPQGALYTLQQRKSGVPTILGWHEAVKVANKERPLFPANTTPSTGHIGFSGSFEYFWAANGDLYRANKNNPLDTKGYRMGARFESTKHAADYFLTQAGLR
jgi:hypothetical protein